MHTITIVAKTPLKNPKGWFENTKISKDFPSNTSILDIFAWEDEVCINGIQHVKTEWPSRKKSGLALCEICGIKFEPPKVNINDYILCDNCSHEVSEMKTTWSNIATGTAKRKKFHVPAEIKYANRFTKIDLICPYCEAVSSPEKWALINKGINCKCGALLTDQGNAYKEEGLS